MRPRIGITTSYKEDEQRLHHSYVEAVATAGGLPMIVPIVAHEAVLNAFVDLLDGLVITGGPAITEGLIGTLPTDLPETDPKRTHADRRILAAFLARRKPILGICYGMQLLNAAAGGTLYADVQQQHVGAGVHSQDRGADTHPVRAVPGTHVARLLGEEELAVNTRHIQAVAQLGGGFRVAATAPDGVIEAIENEEGTILGLQFHPERMGPVMRPLFAHLIQQARAGQPESP